MRDDRGARLLAYAIMVLFFIASTVALFDPTRVTIVQVFTPIAIVAAGFLLGVKVGGKDGEK